MEQEKAYVFSFEKLDMQLSRIIALDIYKMTEAFPDNERFGLTNQLRRAVISVSSNIAEGSARKSLRDQAYMMERSYGSCTEIICQLVISKDLKFITEAQYQKLRLDFEKLTSKLNAYIKQLRLRTDH